MSLQIAFYATQRLGHGQLLKVVRETDKWFILPAKAFFIESLIAAV